MLVFLSIQVFRVYVVIIYFFCGQVFLLSTVCCRGSIPFQSEAFLFLCGSAVIILSCTNTLNVVPKRASIR